MTFILLKDKWYEWDLIHNYVRDSPISHWEPLNDDTPNKHIYGADSWESLFARTGYLPGKSELIARDGWIDPNGNFYKCDAHEILAEKILSIIDPDTFVEYGGDMLIELGWIKVTTSVMWDYYKEKLPYLTPAQVNTLREWCTTYHMNIPKYYIERKVDRFYDV